MRLVCLDTCTKAISVAALEDGNVIKEIWKYTNQNHSEILMPMLSDLLESLNWESDSIDCWAVVNGPGSFTGVRIGVSTARALSHGSASPIITVNSLETIAYQSKTDKRILPMLDARRGQVYWAMYEWKNGSLLELEPPCASSFGDVVNQDKEHSYILIGDGAIANEDYEVLPNYEFASRDYMYIHAANAALIAWQKWNHGIRLSYQDVEPLYVREPQAVRDLKHE